MSTRKGIAYSDQVPQVPEAAGQDQGRQPRGREGSSSCRRGHGDHSDRDDCDRSDQRDLGPESAPGCDRGEHDTGELPVSVREQRDAGEKEEEADDVVVGRAGLS